MAEIVRPAPAVLGTTHRLLRHRLVAHVDTDPQGRIHGVTVPLHTGDRLTIESPADVSRLRRTLRACEDQWRQQRRQP